MQMPPLRDSTTWRGCGWTIALSAQQPAPFVAVDTRFHPPRTPLAHATPLSLPHPTQGARGGWRECTTRGYVGGREGSTPRTFGAGRVQHTAWNLTQLHRRHGDATHEGTHSTHPLYHPHTTNRSQPVVHRLRRPRASVLAGCLRGCSGAHCVVRGVYTAVNRLVRQLQGSSGRGARSPGSQQARRDGGVTWRGTCTKVPQHPAGPGMRCVMGEQWSRWHVFPLERQSRLLGTCTLLTV